ncbi:glycoside hydrolase family 15 protein [Nocardioides sp. CER19]|uniref:glycoside hydrolase family 15 protein n=1 Tax=Nocardioides sp. CER19 TaxID=3038538 RepID=UPI0024473991|nr:glycoside hydrolase family 15 protein [Nocardioides sp. CER19]MDH2413774.1 glycoside hydrolase family 15 protein [Nocardioides sp. CER19]
MSRTPIAQHALLSDCHSTALVDSAGSVEWLTFPRFDSPTAMARLLDDDAGHWSIRPRGDFSVSRRYLEGTLVLETTFRTPSGTAILTDALAMGPDNEGHGLGRDVPHVLVRSMTCETGSVEVEVSYAPRPEYGLVTPVVSQVDGGLAARGGADRLVLSSPVDLAVEAGGATGRHTLRTGETLPFALHRSTWGEPAARVWAADEIDVLLDRTVAAWRSWSVLHERYDGPWRDLVHTSGRVLKALTFQPSGAVVAAPTTSLPEVVGGDRNWDYRYCWVRDASLTLEALWIAACPDEAEEFFAFMATAAASAVAAEQSLQIMFGVGGEHDLTERTLPHLAGWRASAPVRVGNGAWNQTQVDVYGELLGAAHRLREQLTTLDDDTRRFLASLADAAAVRWRETDRGIWEVRGEPRHFLHSKVMCWVALDRAIDMADGIVDGSRVQAWKQARAEIEELVTLHGWSESAGAFTQYIGTDALDASSLMLPITGLLPATDARVLATIDAIEQRLTDERGLVYRYRSDTGVDGFESTEGTFLLCTFWLAQALAMAGLVDRARGVFERAVRYVNDVGLLAEEVDPESGELLGNFPQAFSHIGLVNAAWAISLAEERSPSS